jgi:thioredoxin-like negative regulator of GroEL
MQTEFQALAEYNDTQYALARANVSTNPKIKMHFKIEKPYAVYLIDNGAKMEYSGAIKTAMLKAWFE